MEYCKLCNKLFDPALTGKRVYCSETCAIKAHRIQQRDKARGTYLIAEPREVCRYNRFINCTPSEKNGGKCVRCGWNPAEAERRRNNADRR